MAGSVVLLMDPEIRLGISACLLGQLVRFDGTHKRDTFLTETLGAHVTWVPVCPEDEVGMGTPREAVRLVGAPGDAPRMVGVNSQTDWTERMQDYAAKRVAKLRGEALHGFVFKKDSPSCGLFRVKIYNGEGPPRRDGVGLFAASLVAAYPLLPVEEEGRLRDPGLREHFLDRVFAYARWVRFVESGPKPADLIAFHASHKATLMAHEPDAVARLGRLVAQAGVAAREADAWEDLLDHYGEGFLEALATAATPGGHANVLYHLAGFLRGHANDGDRQELHELIGQYREGLVPLVVPVTLLSHHVRRSDVAAWLRDQTYLHPYPRELRLRNHV